MKTVTSQPAPESVFWQMQNKQTNKQTRCVRQIWSNRLQSFISAAGATILMHLSLCLPFFSPTLYDYIRSRTKAKENCVIITAQGPGFYHTAKISSGNMCEGPAGDFIITLIWVCSQTQRILHTKMIVIAFEKHAFSLTHGANETF